MSEVETMPYRIIESKVETPKIVVAKGELKREITEDFKYNKDKLRHIKHMLHSINVSLGTMVSALAEFSKVKGPDISPDGMLGGKGYILPIREIKEGLNSSIRTLTDIADTLADELSNPKWKAKEDKDVKELLEEKEKVEEKVEEEITPDDVKDSTPEQETSEPESIPEQEVTPEEEAVKEMPEPEKDEDVELAKEATVKTAGLFAQKVKDTLIKFSSVGKSK